MSIVSRLRERVRGARSQVPGLRVPFAVAPFHRKLEPIVRRRLRALGVDDASAFLAELDDVHATVRTAVAEYAMLAPEFAAGSVDPVEGGLLYALVRSRRPDAVVETGTASGISSTYLLAALARNAHGRLYSIDLPFQAGEGDEYHGVVPGTTIDLDDASPIPPGKEPGWAVPAAFRDRWELRLGDARELLPALLGELGEIGVFFHDSLHSREHMLFEFEAAWPHIAPGGVLLADDIFQRRHDALPAFARSVGRPFTTFANLGIVTKP
jgi:predicted O-methyltransferase YrrM